MNLTELRQNLEAQIRGGQLPEALNALLAELPNDSETYRIVSALMARLNAANKERYRNTIDFDEYQRRVDQVSADLFDLLGGLSEADFSATQKPSKTGKAAKTGSVLYRVPNVMQLQKPTRCTIRVAVDEEAILENIVLDEHVEIKSRVEISDVMSAELVDPQGGTFQISALNSRTQLVKETGFTEWNFNVTPLISGIHQLLVKVSIMEVVPGFAEPIPREVSVMETVTIITETAATEEEKTPAFKASGETFTFQDTSNPFKAREIALPTKAAEDTPPSEAPSGNRNLRGVALFLGFLILAPAATWAFTPPATLDWWIASIKDSPEAYAAYIKTYDATESPYLEKAYFLKAQATDQLADLRNYELRFSDSGRYAPNIRTRIAEHEAVAVERIRAQPNATKIKQFVADYPETERLSEVKQAVDARSESRQELLSALEEAYVSSVRTRPTETKVTAYLRDFPKQERLNEVEAAARTKPEVFSRVQPVLEDAYLKKMEQNPTKVQSEQFLEKFPEPVRREKFEQLLDKKPELKKDAQRKMRKMEEARELKKAGG